MKTILVAIDFSEFSKQACQYAIGLAGDTGATLLVTHVAEPQPFLAQSPGDILDEANRELEQNIRTRLSTFIQELHSGLGVSPFPRMEYDVRQGRIVDQIIKVVEEYEVDMIVAGTHGKTGLRDVVFGSHAEQLIQHASVPVLLVPPKCKYTKAGSIAYAVDFRDFDDEDLGQLLDLKQALKARLLLVHVTLEADEEPSGEEAENFARLVAALAEEKKVKYDFPEGEDVFATLSTYAGENHIQILAMKHRNDNLLDRIFNRSLTSLMSYYTTIPLLVFHDTK
jgi:nucleotide-binding universal stress UspA family protein